MTAMRDCKSCKGTGKVRDIQRDNVWDKWPDTFELLQEVQQHIDTLNLPTDERTSSWWLKWEAINDYLKTHYKVTPRSLTTKSNELAKLVQP